MRGEELVDQGLVLFNKVLDEVQLEPSWLIDEERVQLLSDIVDWANDVAESKLEWSGVK